jgi:hypothetical protein
MTPEQEAAKQVFLKKYFPFASLTKDEAEEVRELIWRRHYPVGNLSWNAKHKTPHWKFIPIKRRK